MSPTPYAEDLGPYWVDDAPANGVQVEFLDDSGQITEPPAGTLTATLVGPQSAPDLTPLTVIRDPDSDTITIEWTGFTTFDAAGVWSIIIREQSQRIGALRLVVQAEDGWLSLEDARQDWADAPTSDATTYRILESAKVSCINYAPKSKLIDGVPGHFVQAQLMQARAVWQATKTGDEDQLGADGLTVRVYPLDLNVKAQLRPKRGTPAIR